MLRTPRALDLVRPDINFISMKILSNNMPSIHKIYEYGNIAIEELLDIDISEKVRNTPEKVRNTPKAPKARSTKRC